MKDLEIVSGDFQDESCINEVVNDVDIVYHLISTTIPKTSNENPILDIESNLANTVPITKEVSISESMIIKLIKKQIPINKTSKIRSVNFITIPFPYFLYNF